MSQMSAAPLAMPVRWVWNADVAVYISGMYVYIYIYYKHMSQISAVPPALPVCWVQNADVCIHIPHMYVYVYMTKICHRYQPQH